MQPFGPHNVESFTRLEMQTSFASGERPVWAFGPPRMLILAGATEPVLRNFRVLTQTGPTYLSYIALRVTSRRRARWNRSHRQATAGPDGVLTMLAAIAVPWRGVPTRTDDNGTVGE
jgi:hypothetical protein